MSDSAGLPAPPPPPPVAVRVANGTRFARSMVESCIRRRRHPRPPVPQLTDDQAREWGPLIAERARLVIEEWKRARSPDDSQLVATALMSLSNTIENAAAVQEPVEPATADAGT